MGGVAKPLILHASTVALKGRGVVILGASGSGKSALALELMALGAGLVADDRTIVTRDADRLIADCPEALRGRIEARYVGLLKADPHGPVPLALAIDLDRSEDQRLPPWRTSNIAGVTLPMLHKTAHSHFAAAIFQYLMQGRHD